MIPVLRFPEEGVPMFGQLYFLLKKELIQLFRNPKMRVTLIVPPVMQLLVLGYAATLDLKRVDMAFLDRSQSAQSRELKSCFVGSPTFVVADDLDSQQDLQARIERRAISLAVVVPPDFQRDLALGQTANVQIISDGRAANSSALASAYAANIITAWQTRRLTEQGTNPDKWLTVKSRAWYNPNYEARFFMVPALLAMIALLDLLIIVSLSIAREREDGTFDQLRLTPFETWQLLAAKGFSGIIVSVIQLSLGYLVARLWFQIPYMSSPLLLIALLFSFLMASMGIGLFISVLSQNLQQALLGMFIVAIPFAMLSGLGTPLESMPEFLQTITIINPLRHGVQALPRLFLEGATFDQLIVSFAFLWATAIGMFTAAYVLFARQRAED